MSRSSVGVGCSRATVMSCRGTSSSSTWIGHAGKRRGADDAVEIARTLEDHPLRQQDQRLGAFDDRKAGQEVVEAAQRLGRVLPHAPYQRAAFAQHVALALLEGHADQAGAFAQNHLREDPAVALLGDRNRFVQADVEPARVGLLPADDALHRLLESQTIVGETRPEMPGSG